MNKVDNEILEITSQMSEKEKLKYYIELTKETIEKSTDLILLEKSRIMLKNFEDSLLDVLTEEYDLREIDINN
jgi:hypothetical protein